MHTTEATVTFSEVDASNGSIYVYYNDEEKLDFGEIVDMKRHLFDDYPIGLRYQFVCHEEAVYNHNVLMAIVEKVKSLNDECESEKM